jgi:hypothetical protein
MVGDPVRGGVMRRKEGAGAASNDLKPTGVGSVCRQRSGVSRGGREGTDRCAAATVPMAVKTDSSRFK